MSIESSISNLLYRYQCVIVPGFGAFLGNETLTRIDLNSNTIHPPRKNVSFNRQLQKNDGLLVSHLASVNGHAYDHQLELLSSQVNEWNKSLENGDTLDLPGLGKIWSGLENKLQFTPESGTNYLASSFGLPSFLITNIERKKAADLEVIAEEVIVEEEVEATAPVVVYASKWREPLKYAAVGLLLLSIGTSLYNLRSNQVNTDAYVHQKAQEKVTEKIQEATFFSESPILLPAIDIEIGKKATPKTPAEGKHHIIAGAFRFEANAHKKVDELRSKGFPAAYLGTNDHGLHQVTFNSFDDPKKALDYLREIKYTVSSDAWMLSRR